MSINLNEKAMIVLYEDKFLKQSCQHTKRDLLKAALPILEEWFKELLEEEGNESLKGTEINLPMFYTKNFLDYIHKLLNDK